MQTNDNWFHYWHWHLRKMAKKCTSISFLSLMLEWTSNFLQSFKLSFQFVFPLRIFFLWMYVFFLTLSICHTYIESSFILNKVQTSEIFRKCFFFRWKNMWWIFFEEIIPLFEKKRSINQCQYCKWKARNWSKISARISHESLCL